MSFSKWSIIGIILFTILCGILRILGIGWILFFLFWIIIPYYILHFLGQVITIIRKDVTLKEKRLIYVSTLLLFILTLIQYDCDDSRYYYLIDGATGMLFGKTFLPEPNTGWFMISITITLAAIDSVINIYLLIRANRARKNKTVGIITVK